VFLEAWRKAALTFECSWPRARALQLGYHPAAGQHLHILAAAEKRVFNAVVQLAAHTGLLTAIASRGGPSCILQLLG
jgi:hypothetical protein